jgi:hypothetical protein
MIKSKLTTAALAATLTIGLSCSAIAGDYLDSAAIRDLVTGNSLHGDYDGSKFKQNFHADGTVVVFIAGDQVYNVNWIANERNQYCEYWGEEWGWSCFKFQAPVDGKLTAVKVGDEKSVYTWNLEPGFIDINP